MTLLDDSHDHTLTLPVTGGALAPAEPATLVADDLTSSVNAWLLLIRVAARALVVFLFGIPATLRVRDDVAVAVVAFHPFVTPSVDRTWPTCVWWDRAWWRAGRAFPLWG